MTIASLIDHTLLKPTATHTQILNLCNEAKHHGFYSVCVNPRWIPLCVNELKFSNVKPITVVGFPLGAATTAQKIYETHTAVADGAQEIDMVIDISLALEEKWQELTEEIHSIVRASKGLPLKVILETGYLNSDQIFKASQSCAKAEAHFVKTSTGFGPRGASLDDIGLIKEAIKGSNLKIKASGGIKTFDDLKNFTEAGAHRIGTSNSVEICLQSLNGK